MAPFVEAAEAVLQKVEDDGAHEASPQNLELPTLIALVAGWAAYESAMACDHCEETLGLKSGRGPAAAAYEEAARTVAWFTGSLLLVMGEACDENGEAIPWLPAWAQLEYELFVRAAPRQEEGVAPIYEALFTKRWGLELTTGYLSLLLMEVGMRLGPTSAEADAIREVEDRWPEASAHEAFEKGAAGLGLPAQELQAAWIAAQRVLEGHLTKNVESGAMRLPPPAVSLH